mgnify:CR=1 FL=1
MLRIEGYSDDIIEANIEMQGTCPCCGAEVKEPSGGVVGEKSDEIWAYDQKVHFIIGSKEGGVEVTMFMAVTGCWAAVEKVDVDG